MNCERTEQIIRDAFDRGWEIDLNDPHLKACNSCKTYLQEIQGIEASLDGIGLESHSHCLVERIQARVADERAPGNAAWQWAPWAAAAIFIVSGLALWLQPGWAGFESELGRAMSAFPGQTWVSVEAPLSEPVAAAWENVLYVSERARNLSGMATGVTTSVLLISLILFNLAVAVRLRSSAGPGDRTLLP